MKVNLQVVWPSSCPSDFGEDSAKMDDGIPKFMGDVNLGIVYS